MTWTRLMFLLLAIASFAPVVMGFGPGWWVAHYYGALLVCWILVSVASVRRTNRNEQTAEDPLDEGRAGRQGRSARHELDETRLIIVAREQPDLYVRIRRVQFRDSAVRVITDRRTANRRRQLEVYIPDRRRAERRCSDIGPLLRTRGWAQAPRSKV